MCLTFIVCTIHKVRQAHRGKHCFQNMKLNISLTVEKFDMELT